MFFFSERELKKVLRDTMTRAGMGQAFSDHTHASYLARPGSDPVWGGKKGEFRDWTTYKHKNKYCYGSNIIYYLHINKCAYLEEVSEHEKLLCSFLDYSCPVPEEVDVSFLFRIYLINYIISLVINNY